MTMPFTMGYQDPYMTTQTVDETASMTDMQGPSSSVNQLAGAATWTSSPTKALIGLWVLCMAAYWMMGWLFRGQRG